MLKTFLRGCKFSMERTKVMTLLEISWIVVRKKRWTNFTLREKMGNFNFCWTTFTFAGEVGQLKFYVFFLGEAFTFVWKSGQLSLFSGEAFTVVWKSGQLSLFQEKLSLLYENLDNFHFFRRSWTTFTPSKASCLNGLTTGTQTCPLLRF